jgi:hypothetical protein
MKGTVLNVRYRTGKKDADPLLNRSLSSVVNQVFKVKPKSKGFCGLQCKSERPFGERLLKNSLLRALAGKPVVDSYQESLPEIPPWALIKRLISPIL